MRRSRPWPETEKKWQDRLQHELVDYWNVVSIKPVAKVLVCLAVEIAIDGLSLVEGFPASTRPCLVGFSTGVEGNQGDLASQR